MTSRYYTNQYHANAYGSAYRSRGSKSSAHYYAKSPSNKAVKGGRAGATRTSVIRDSGRIPGPYSPTLGRKRPTGLWKAKKKKDDEEKRTKRGEFNQEAIEAELNKYKKGVFYHDDDKEKSTALNGHSKSGSEKSSDKQFAHYQLTRTQHSSSQPYGGLPRPVPPNYEERIKSKDFLSDDVKTREEDSTPTRNVTKVSRRKKDIDDSKRSSKKLRKKRSSRPPAAAMVTVSPSRYPPAYNTPYGMPQDYYYYPAGYAGTGGMIADDVYGTMAAAPAPYGADYLRYDTPYGYPPAGRGVVHNDGLWYPYPDLLQTAAAPMIDPYATPKRGARPRDIVIDSANVDLTSPLKDDKALEQMSPGRRVNKIQKQLEYYFSPQNMSVDKWLREEMNEEGWVDIDKILNFNRMRVLGATKDLVIEAAFHSQAIEIETKNQEQIRMTGLWQQYVMDEKLKRLNDDQKDNENDKKKVKKSKKNRQRFDDSELNSKVIASIVNDIEERFEKKSKKRAQREKEKEKAENESETKTSSSEDNEQNDKRKKNEQIDTEDTKNVATLIKNDEEQTKNNENENGDEDDTVDID